ncbi:hypothetical protein Y032_0091g2490 [Ancylostoma ceylanicum]|uniref:Uncharacterized protein n=1 Tax=Ancylostoma ceylanicum TaxID=53326 RepID=A0A016TN05_9BILA|nr:hypothetical protein Y032_0091g2490 [Ancylostoma ceylanicum]
MWDSGAAFSSRDTRASMQNPCVSAQERRAAVPPLAYINSSLHVKNIGDGMDADVRVVPFTDEEKARLNEKVRKMKFSRPPPKLPGTRITARVLPNPQKVSRLSGSTDGEKSERNTSVDDSGISSCGSEKCETPVHQSSLSEMTEQPFEVECDKYVCDGDDWIQDDYPPELQNDLDIDIDHGGFQEDCVRPSTSMNSDSPELADSLLGDVDKDVKNDSKDGGLEIEVDPHAALSVDVTSFGPVEKIDPASPVVFSERLQEILTRKRAELMMEISPLPDRPIGKFEEPKYGRLLLSTTFPTASLQHIMESTLENLMGYRVLGRPKICQARGKPPPDPSMISDIEAELNKECVVSQSPKATVLKRKREKKRNKKRAGEGSSLLTDNSAILSGRMSTDEPSAASTSAKKRKRSWQAPTPSPSGAPPIKMIFRKDADRKISGVRLEIADMSGLTAQQRVKLEHDLSDPIEEKPLCTPLSSPSKAEIVKSPQLGDGNGGLKIRIKLPPQNPVKMNGAQNTEQTVQPAASANVDKIPVKKNSNPVHEDQRKRISNSNHDSDDDIVIVHENIRKPPKPAVAPRPWAQLNVVEESFVAKLASLLKMDEVDISRPDWLNDLCGKVEKAVYLLELDISTLKGTRTKCRKRLEQLQLTRHHLKMLQIKRQNRSWDEDYRMGPGGSSEELWHHRLCPRILRNGQVKITRRNISDCGDCQLKRTISGCGDHLGQTDIFQSSSTPSSDIAAPPEVVPKDPKPSHYTLPPGCTEEELRIALQNEQNASQMTPKERRILERVLSPDDLKFYRINALKPPPVVKRSSSARGRASYPPGLDKNRYYYKDGVAFERKYKRLPGSRVTLFTHHRVVPSAVNSGREQ